MSSMSGNTGYKAPSGYKAFEQYDAPQKAAYAQQQQLSSPESYTAKLAGGGDQAMWDQLEAPAKRLFNEFQGENASRFSGMGLGARKGSGFQNSQNTATSNFAQDLASNRMSLQQQAIKDLYSMSNDLLNKKPYGLQKKERKPKWWESVLGGAAPLAGGAVGGFFGGPMGAAAGYGAGKSFSNSIMGGQQEQQNDSGYGQLSTSWS